MYLPIFAFCNIRREKNKKMELAYIFLILLQYGAPSFWQLEPKVRNTNNSGKKIFDLS